MVSDISISWGYLFAQMLFWQLLYLHWLNIRCCRCSFGDQCIYKALIFLVADALLETNVICNLLFFELADTFNPAYHVNCICILPFLKPEDASFANFASTSHIFDNMRMFLIEIMHPPLALSITYRYSPPKLYIFNFRKSIITDIAAQYPLSSI